jgi:3-oxoacyl-[acyl-carrier protein] reductase
MTFAHWERANKEGCMRLARKVAVITGAAGAIGSAIARRFVVEAASVALLDVDETGAARVAQELIESGAGADHAMAMRCDVSSPEDIEAAFARIDERWGRVDIAVANAGIGRGSPFLDIGVPDWQTVMDVNLTGVFLTCQAAARRMVKQGSGVIVTMSSTNGLVGERDLAAYNASKAGVLLLTKTMAIELAQYGIRCNALNPGFIDTGLAEKAGLDPEFVRSYVDKIPMGRLGRPDEVAGAALFLCTDDASFITGIGLVVDGGQLSEE